MEEDRKGETKELDPDLLCNRELQKGLEKHFPHYRSRFRVKHEEIKGGRQIDLSVRLKQTPLFHVFFILSI
jgi:hypothetical protein